MENNPEPLPPELRAAFDDYPRPVGDAQFDAKFWRELDNRRNRYRGVAGVVRRLVEVEIEGIAVWRLGAALFGGAAVCAIGVALLSLGSAPLAPTTSAPIVAELEQIPTAMPRYAREMDAWTNRPQPAIEPRVPAKKEVSLCDSLLKDWA